MLDFLRKTEQNNENYWAILIEPEWISSSVWQIEDGKVKVISTAPSVRWEGDLIEPVDSSLSVCMQNLPDEIPDPTKTVFGLPSSWIEGGNIKEEHLAILKKICDDLSLIPSGFVVLSEAICHYYKNEEGAGLSGIVVGISDQNLEISIFNLGVLVGVTIVSRSISIEDDLTEGLTRLSSNLDNFPSRIIIFNQKESELEEIREILNNSDWNKIGGSKFIHTPKSEIFNPQNKIIAVSLAGGSEMGATSGVVVSKFDENNIEEELETETEKLPLEEVANVEESTDLTAQDLGFVSEDSLAKEIIPQELPKIKNFNFKKYIPNIPKVNLRFLSGSKPLVIGGSALLTFLVAFFLYWWFVPKAVVTIYVSSKQLEENLTLNISEIKNEQLSVVVEGEKSKTTTGIKTVGEKAKGQVKIQNGTAFPINLSAGSILVSSSDLKFVTINSASVSGALSPSNPGTATIEVEAGSIGSEYNISKDEVFKVANYPKAEVDATSIDGFNGGSSRQISSVSEDDRSSILKSLEEELLEDAKNKLISEISGDSYLIDSSLSTTVEEEDYSNKVGDESTSIKLFLKLEVKGIVVLKSDLASLAKESLSSKVPEGFVLKEDQLKYQFESNDENFDIRVIANLLPNIDPVEIAKKIAGKYPHLAEVYLSDIPGFVRAEFRIKPLLPNKLGTLPHVVGNMSVEFSGE